VKAALSTSGSDVGYLANEWRQYFFPEADDAQFADAYAQTVTYAMESRPAIRGYEPLAKRGR